MVQCLVQLLDGTDCEVDVNKKCTGEQLMNAVCEKLNLVERAFFGMTYVQNQVKFWINNTKQINKQIKKGPWHVAFELKFYPDPMLLHEEITRYQAYLQLRRDISTGKLPCSFVAVALLGSFAAQSQLGDHKPETHGNSGEYLKGLELSPNQNDELLDRIAELHSTHRGLTPSEAELYYLDNAKNLALYGMHMHEAKDSEGDDVNIGVCAAGLLVYKDRLRVHRYTWPKILKIRYKRNFFHIDVRPEVGDETAPVDSYKLSGVKMAKRLWRIAVEHHAFFRLREPEAESRTMFSRVPYRYTGRTLYQTQHDAARTNRNPEFSRSAGGHVTGTRSMDNLALGYSTERAEKHIADDPRTITLDLRQQRGTGSLGDLDRLAYDPNIDGQLSLLVGEGRATYSRPVNGSVSYNTAGGQFGGQYGQPGNPSFMTQQRDGYDMRWNGTSSVAVRPDSVSSDVSSVPDATSRPTRRKRITSRDSRRSSQSNERGQDYTTSSDAEANGWTPHASSTLTKTSTMTYTAPDGSIVTEYRTERNGVIETHIEKRARAASIAEEDNIDHDKELMDAIFAVTDMDPNMSVQKIEIHTKSEQV